MIRKTCVTMVLAAAAIAGGCSSEPKEESKSDYSPDFFDAPATRANEAFMTAQARAGARNDATLQPMHFTDNKLNSLGRAKLDLITDGIDSPVTTVYLNFAESDDMDVRRNAVAEYLRVEGYDEAMFKFVSGPNADATSATAGHLSRMVRTESDGTTFDADSETKK